MKSINQIFKNNHHLMDIPQVEELIDYTKELEDIVIENDQIIDQTVILKQLISEIRQSCSSMIEEDEKHKRWPKDFDEVDFREVIKNLKDYINLYCLDNKIRL
jgi:hypothetical protein